jgi:DNA-binding response OmpR family regulator
MSSLALSGRSILVVEEEPDVSRQLVDQFHRAGAKVFAAARLEDALYLAEHPALSAAVVNLRMGADNTAHVCRRLDHLGIPFVLHTRYDTAEACRRWPDVPVVSKPADSAMVVDAVVRRLMH